MKKRKALLALLFCLAIATIWATYSQRAGQAEEQPQYVGTELCANCHADVYKVWTLSVHRKTLFNEDPSHRGCEACHGPGGAHVAAGGDKEKIIRPQMLTSDKSSAICQKCHSQDEVTLWRTSAHARAKLTCTNCHDPHGGETRKLLSEADGTKLSLEGISRALRQAQLAGDTAQAGSAEKEAAEKRVIELKAEQKKLRDELKNIESVYQRTTEPFVCYSCHKTQQIQNNLPSHHPIQEGKVNCSSCHNPHGGPHGLLREESVPETCYRCHADKVGPFTFEHPPVAENCTICHNPHGSVQNKLLAQSEPFVCQKCHAGPHSRSSTLAEANPQTFANYYTECTDCHTQVHGSDEHVALHY